ncbi:Transposon Ty3-I Gag-Pol poly [Paramuricea clavata]|uniref:Transposon Ty3-I Gag-Pol poly n=1 Tax=Paramuricea clavata TaxID=317549 RepID=A0A6S7HII0_PARCT|nr:Transposon Ty3-I Gag-Pol poly [Paramuricea clavata]
MGKYTAFDLDILKISVNELLQVQQPERELSNPLPEKVTKQQGTHMAYSNMAKQLTPLSKVTDFVTQLHQQKSTGESPVSQIVKKHPKVFQGIGKHKYRQVELIIDDSVQPKVQAQRRIPFPKRQQFEEIIQELEEADIIEQVEGPTEWISNVVLTPKADPSQLRMNIDMTTADTAIKRTRHVIPTLEELRYKLNGATHFTKLDMKQGYMQLELKQESRYMTTFYTHRGLRRFKRLNFGTNSAAELFHEEISQCLIDIDNADNLYDDIIVYGKTQQEHDIALAQVLQRFEDCGLTLGLPKCKFDQPEIEFFGMKFSAAGMSPTADKVKALIEAPAPTSVAEVRSFLGMANYSANFIQHYSETTAPLRHLTKKNARFQWTKECQKAFETLKQAMASPQVMSYYDPTRPTELIVDASKYGLASMLTQLDPKTGQYKVVRYDSRSTTQPESRYAQIELESAAVEFAIRRNHIYLYGLPEFSVITDHKPLLPLYNSYRADMPPRIHRHKLNLQGYTFNLKHKPGKDNPTDYMSRHPTQIPDSREQKEQQEAQLINHHIKAIIRDDLPVAVTLEQMKTATGKDPTMQRLIQAIQTGYISNPDKQELMPYSHVFKELSTVEGLVLRGSKMVVPESLRNQVVTLAHEGHQGIVRTKQFLRATTWFPGMDKRVEKEIAHCMPCQITVKTPQQEPLKPTVLPGEPWDVLATDLHGPLPTGEYLLVVQCLYSRYPAVEIVRSTSADTCIPVLDKVLSQFGIPTQITSDNGPPYNSEKFRQYAKYMGFEHKKKIPYASVGKWHRGELHEKPRKTYRNSARGKIKLAPRTPQISACISSHSTSNDKEIASFSPV